MLAGRGKYKHQNHDTIQHFGFITLNASFSTRYCSRSAGKGKDTQQCCVTIQHFEFIIPNASFSTRYCSRSAGKGLGLSFLMPPSLPGAALRLAGRGKYTHQCYVTLQHSGVIIPNATFSTRCCSQIGWQGQTCISVLCYTSALWVYHTLRHLLHQVPLQSWLAGRGKYTHQCHVTLHSTLGLSFLKQLSLPGAALRLAGWGKYTHQRYDTLQHFEFIIHTDTFSIRCPSKFGWLANTQIIVMCFGFV